MAGLSLFGVLVGLGLLIFLAYKGHSTIWVAPFCAFIVACFALGAGLGEGRTLLSSYTVDYMRGAGEYFITWFPAFFLGAVYGKIMDVTGSARSLANAIVKVIGPKFAVLAVVLPCLALTYGGISLFVVVFVIYPMGYAIYRAADLPRTLLPGAIAYGAFGISMTALPGTPQIQNLIPMSYFGTTPMAAPIMSIVAVIIIGIPGYLWLDYRARKAKREGRGFIEDPKFEGVEHDESKLPSWHWITGLVPIVVVFVALNILNWGIVIAMVLAIITCCLLNIQHIKLFLPAFSAGAAGSLTAIMNTASEVGFGSVVKIVPGFQLLTNAMLSNNASGVSLLFSEAVAVNVLAGATGSASGGMSIALAALGDKYLQMANAIGLNPEYLHRIASLASGGMDTLPHNGAVLTLLAVSHCTHKESYLDICVTTCIIPILGSLSLSLIWGLFMV